MPSRGVLLGVAALMVALLLISSSVALVYYVQYQHEVSKNESYVGELDAALASYRSLEDSYNSSLDGYNTTLSLLATALANLNTSTPAYKEASAAISSLWNSYEQFAGTNGKKPVGYGVQMLLDYGNGTSQWYNDTSIQPGWDAYVVSLVLLGGRMDATWYPQYGEHFVTALNGVASGSSDSWFVWAYGSGGWQVSLTGADGVPILNGTTFAWTLCGYDSSFNPTCLP